MAKLDRLHDYFLQSFPDSSSKSQGSRGRRRPLFAYLTQEILPHCLQDIALKLTGVLRDREEDIQCCREKDLIFISNSVRLGSVTPITGRRLSPHTGVGQRQRVPRLRELASLARGVQDGITQPWRCSLAEPGKGSCMKTAISNVATRITIQNCRRRPQDPRRARPLSLPAAGPVGGGAPGAAGGRFNRKKMVWASFRANF